MEKSNPGKNQANSERLAEHATIAFLEACSDWQLSEDEELSLAGYPDPKKYQSWCVSALDNKPFQLEEWRLLRMGAISGISRSITSVLPKKQDRLHWLRGSIRGPLCHGLSPLEIMCDPEPYNVIAFRKRLDEWIATPWLKGSQIALKQPIIRKTQRMSAQDIMLSILRTGDIHK